MKEDLNLSTYVVKSLKYSEWLLCSCADLTSVWGVHPQSFQSQPIISLYNPCKTLVYFVCLDKIKGFWHYMGCWETEGWKERFFILPGWWGMSRHHKIEAIVEKACSVQNSKTGKRLGICMFFCSCLPLDNEYREARFWNILSLRFERGLLFPRCCQRKKTRP